MEWRRVSAFLIVVLAAFFAGFVFDGSTQYIPKYASFKEPLVWVGVATLFVISWQALETRRAAEGTQIAAEATKASAEAASAQVEVMRTQTRATEEMVAVQRFAMQQWVQVESWSVAHKLSDKSEIIMLVNFTVVNPTSFPLTISKILTTFGEEQSETLEVFLVPREGRSFTRRLNMTRFQHNHGMQRHLTVDLVVFVCYEDVFAETKFQAFGQTCIFDMEYRKARFEPYVGVLPPIHKPVGDDDF